MNDLRQALRSFIVGHFLYGEDNGLADHDSFLERSVLDSTGVLELVSHLEQTYAFKITDEELIPDHLDSIDSLVQFVQRKLAAAPPPATPAPHPASPP